MLCCWYCDASIYDYNYYVLFLHVDDVYFCNENCYKDWMRERRRK